MPHDDDGVPVHYTLDAVYRVQPAPEPEALETCLDVVADELHPHDVDISSQGPDAVRLVVQMRGVTVTDILSRVSRCLTIFAEALRGCVRARPASSRPTLTLLKADQRFL